jgi:hypothetical protein
MIRGMGLAAKAISVTTGFAILTTANGGAGVGVVTPFKLSAGDDFAVHAATPITKQIRASVNAR